MSVLYLIGLKPPPIQSLYPRART